MSKIKELPKFIHFPNFTQGREVVIHTQCPRFIAEVINTEGVIDIKRVEFFDPPQADAKALAGLMSRMGDWYYHTVIEKK